MSNSSKKQKNQKTKKIFFSYSHHDRDEPTNEWLVRAFRQRLHDDKNGAYDIFLDKYSIHVDNDWRRTIKTRLKNSQCLCAFVSVAALNERSVCLDELSIGYCIPKLKILTILLDAEDKIQLPATLTRKQWLDMHDWKEYYRKGEKEWQKYFNKNYREICKVLDNNESIVLQKEVQYLDQILLPELCEKKLLDCLSKSVIGREWLKEIVEEWSIDRNSPRFLHLVGGAGTGKSFFIANAIHYNPNVVGGYFCEWDKDAVKPIHKILKSLAFQFATRNAEYRDDLIKKIKRVKKYCGNEQVFFERMKDYSNLELYHLLFDCLREGIDGNQSPLILMIDGVDELSDGLSNELMNLLTSKEIQELPAYIKFIITSRDEPGLQAGFNALSRKEINISQDRRSSEDIRKYLNKQLGNRIDNGDLSGDLIDKLTEKSEGVFIYAEKICDAYKDGCFSFNDDKLPKDLGGIYLKWFQCRFMKDYYNGKLYPAISLMIATEKYRITIDTFRTLLNWNKREVNNFEAEMRSFVVEYEDKFGKHLGFYHKSIADWLCDKAQSGDFSVFLEDSFAELDEKLEEIYKNKTKLFRNTELDLLIFKRLYEENQNNATLRETLFNDYEFLYRLQVELSKKSLFDEAKKAAKPLEELYKRNQKDGTIRLYYIKSLIYKAEILNYQKLLAETKAAYDDITNRFFDYIKEDKNTYYIYRNYYIWTDIKSNPEKALSDFDELLTEIEKENDFSEKDAIWANILYERGVTLYNIARKKGSEEKQKYYYQSLNSMNEALSKNIIDPVKAKETRMLCLNTMSSSYNGLCEYEKMYDTAIESLQLRLELHGEMSHYTSIGYDTLARACNICLEKNIPIQTSFEEIFALIEKPIEINSILFGEDSPNCARNYQTKAHIYKNMTKKTEALQWANKALAIYKKGTDRDAIDNTEKLIKEIEKLT